MEPIAFVKEVKIARIHQSTAATSKNKLVSTGTSEDNTQSRATNLGVEIDGPSIQVNNANKTTTIPTQLELTADTDTSNVIQTQTQADSTHDATDNLSVAKQLNNGKADVISSDNHIETPQNNEFGAAVHRNIFAKKHTMRAEAKRIAKENKSMKLWIEMLKEENHHLEKMVKVFQQPPVPENMVGFVCVFA